MSKAKIINIVRLRKNRKEDTWLNGYGTDGLKPEVRCLTHRLIPEEGNDVYFSGRTHEHHNRTHRVYYFKANIEEEKKGKEFLVFYEAIFRNQFVNDKEFWSAWLKSDFKTKPTDKPKKSKGEIVFIIMFPDDRPFKKVPSLFRFLEHGEIHANSTELKYESPDKKAIEYKDMEETEQKSKFKYTEDVRYNLDADEKFIYMSIQKPLLNYSYEIRWNW